MAIGGSSELKDSPGQWRMKNSYENGTSSKMPCYEHQNMEIWIFFPPAFLFCGCWHAEIAQGMTSLNPSFTYRAQFYKKCAEEVIAELQVEFEVWWHLSLLGKLAIFSWLHQWRVRLSTQLGEEWESTVIQYDWAGVHRGWHLTQLYRDYHKPWHYWIPELKNQEIPRESLPTLTVAQLRSTCDMPSFASATNRCSSEAFGKAIFETKKSRCCVCV